MPIEYRELFDALEELCKIKDLKATCITTAKAGLITGAATAVGGLVLGRLGLLLGAAIGVATAVASTDDCKPVWIILRDLPPGQRNKLCFNVISAFKNVGFEDVASISALLLTHPSLQDAAIKVICNFLKNEFNLQLM